MRGGGAVGEGSIKTDCQSGDKRPGWKAMRECRGRAPSLDLNLELRIVVCRDCGDSLRTVEGGTSERPV